MVYILKENSIKKGPIDGAFFLNIWYNYGGDNMDNIKRNMNRHNEILSEYACTDSEAIRLCPIKSDIRTDFFRDADKILYSLAYSRYIDKTQVF